MDRGEGPEGRMETEIEIISKFVMAGLGPASHHARVCERKSVDRRVDTRRMDGRLKGGHDETGFSR